MTTFNRIDCARINQEIIKYNYNYPLFIAHACSSPDYEGYIEDVVVKSRPSSLRLGALQLLKDSLIAALENSSPSFIIHIEGDTWLLDQEVIFDLIKQMSENDKILLCASSWENLDPSTLPLYLDETDLLQFAKLFMGKITRRLGFKKNNMFDFATQFFIVKNYQPLIDAILDMPPREDILLEKNFFDNFMKVANIENVLRLQVREPTLPDYRWTCPAIGLYSQHWPAKDNAEIITANILTEYLVGKKEVLLDYPKIRTGHYIQMLLNSTNYDYYNPGARRC